MIMCQLVVRLFISTMIRYDSSSSNVVSFASKGYMIIDGGHGAIMFLKIMKSLKEEKLNLILFEDNGDLGKRYSLEIF